MKNLRFELFRDLTRDHIYHLLDKFECILVTFEKGKFNETQTFELLGDDIEIPYEDERVASALAMEYAKVMREIADYAASDTRNRDIYMSE